MTAAKTRQQQTPEQRREAKAARWKMLADLAETMAVAMELDPLTAEQVHQVAQATGYTERNASLIVGQCAAASVAKPFKAWKAEGRQVRKGEKALWIIASTAKRRAGDEAQEGEQERKQEGSEQEQEQEGEKTARRFVTVPVFDVSQTDPITEDEADSER